MELGELTLLTCNSDGRRSARDATSARPADPEDSPRGRAGGRARAGPPRRAAGQLGGGERLLRAGDRLELLVYVCREAHLAALEGERDIAVRSTRSDEHGRPPLERRSRGRAPRARGAERTGRRGSAAASGRAARPRPPLDVLAARAAPQSARPARRRRRRCHDRRNPTSSPSSSSAALKASSQVTTLTPTVRCSESVSEVSASCSQPRGR